MLKIDSHHHLWDLDITPQAWIKGAEMDLINQNFTISDLESAIKSSGITKTIIVQTVPNYSETPLLLDMAQTDSPICGVVGWLEIAADDAMERLEEFSHHVNFQSLVGIRDMAQDLEDSHYLARPMSIMNVRALGKKNLTYDILIKPPQLPSALTLVQSAPETRFIVDHAAKPLIKIGGIEPWKILMKELASFENVACKVSGLITEADWKNWKISDFEPYFEVLFEAFGVNRLLFGSDWPVALLAGSYEDVVKLAENLTSFMSTSESEKFWGLNAIEWYQLEPLLAD